eukprot:TRINITY_DN1048_c0_g1_i1.p1 TRINITY_DN1048_c0_g1~~TRINITY_DN1048_c0_g1_i1.p1  ORF type:complete len:294 (-),score=42.58 TRINITY_DN1048_c0_g1_i1:237-1118(-)
MPIYSSSSVIIVQQPHNSISTVTRIYGSSPKDRSTNQFLYSTSPVEDGFFNDDSDSDMSSTEDCSEDEFELAAADYDSDDNEDFTFKDDSESDVETVNSECQPPATFIDDVAFAEIPFWFNNEEEDQIKTILLQYDSKCGLQERRKKIIRAPPPFVGRVTRTQVRNLEFATLDKVEIYLLDVLPQWSPLNCTEKQYFLTTWDKESGLPAYSTPLTDKDKIRFWRDRSSTDSISYLYSNPVYQSAGDFRYHVSNQKEDVMFSTMPFIFSKYVPTSPRKKVAEDGADLLDDPLND